MLNLAADSFSRYLRAKKPIDDRSLNRWVYETLINSLKVKSRKQPLDIMEIGCGIGTMVERLWDWGLVPAASYTAIDREPGLIGEARERLKDFADRRGLTVSEPEGRLRLQGPGRDWLITLQANDYLAFSRQQAGKSPADLLLAHAFLDLVELDTGLPRLLSLLRPGGWYYFTLIFDGVTIWQPPVDPLFEEQLVLMYHQSMDEREGGRAGHSQTGRRVLAELSRVAGGVLAAGSSDWVVWPAATGSYPDDEAFFLEYLLETMQRALSARPELDQNRLQTWLSRRRAQLAAGELIFLAHQLDVCGRQV